MKATEFFYSRSFHNHERQAIPLPEPFEKIREALEKIEQDSVREWSPAQSYYTRAE